MGFHFEKHLCFSQVHRLMFTVLLELIGLMESHVMNMVKSLNDKQTEIAKTEGPIDFFSYFFLNFFFDKRSNRDREWERDTKRDKEWQSVNKKYWLSNLQEKTMSYKTKQLQSHQRCSSCTTLSATKITFDFANTNTYTWSH